MDWERSQESKYLTGAGLPPEGLQCTLVSFRTDMMQKRDAPEGQLEEVYIAKLAELEQEWVVNVTGRRWLTQHCGLTNANIHAFAPIPLTLVQIETGKGTGIKPIRRVVVAPAVVTAPTDPAGPVVSPTVPAAAVGEPIPVGDEVPF